MANGKNKCKADFAIFGILLAIGFLIVCSIIIFAVYAAPKNQILKCDRPHGCTFAKNVFKGRGYGSSIKYTDRFRPDEISEINCNNNNCYIIITPHVISDKGYHYRKDITPKMYLELVKFLQAKQDDVYVNENTNLSWVVLIILAITVALRFL